MATRISVKEIVSLSIQHFWTNEELPSAADLSEITGHTAERIDAILKRPEVIQSLAAFHMPTTDARGLSPQQLVWANMLVNIDDPRPLRKKSQELGITMSQHAAWMNTPKFREYVQSRAAKTFGNEKWQVYLSLLSNARSGDVSAQKLYLELLGDYQPAARVNVNNTTNVNMGHTLNLILEVLQIHVKDPETLLAIADDVQAISEGKIPASLQAGTAQQVIEIQESTEKQLIDF